MTPPTLAPAETPLPTDRSGALRPQGRGGIRATGSERAVSSRIIAMATNPRCALGAGILAAAGLIAAGPLLGVPAVLVGLGVAAFLLAPVHLWRARHRVREAELLALLAHVADCLDAPNRSAQEVAGAARAVANDNTWWRDRLGLADEAAARRDRLKRLLDTRSAFADGCEMARRKTRSTAVAVDRMPELCRLAETQLGSIRRDGEMAAFIMMESLRALDGHVEAAARSTALFRADTAFGDAPENGLAPLCSSLARTVGQHRAATAERARSSAAMQERVQEALEAAVREARTLDADVRRFGRLAFNATLESLRGEGRSSGSSVVAKEMVDSAARTGAAVAALLERLDTLAQAIAARSHQSAQRGEEERDDFDRVEERLERLSVAADRATRETSAFADRLDTYFRLQADAIMNAIAQLQRQDIMRQKAENLEKTFNDLAQFGRELGLYLADDARTDIGDMSHLIEGLRARYVTEDERRVDAMLSGRSEADAGADLPAIELF